MREGCIFFDFARTIRANLFRKEQTIMETNQKNPDVTLLQGVYKAVSMGTDSVLTILGKAKEKDIRRELTAELDGYQNFANLTRGRLSSLSANAEEVGMLTKLPAELSIRMSTLTDDSSSKLAELMINGSTMGVIDLQKEINAAESAGAKHENIQLAQGVLNFQQENIDKMKNFL